MEKRLYKKELYSKPVIIYGKNYIKKQIMQKKNNIEKETI